MAINIIERAITPYNRSDNKVTQKQGYSLYAPIATEGKVGMAGFDIEDFVVAEQIVKLKPIKTGKIADNAVTTGKIADNAVTTGKIADGVITNDKLSDGTIGDDKIADGAVKTGKIADNAVTTDKIADNAITTDKIADKAIGRTKFDDALQEHLNKSLAMPKYDPETGIIKFTTVDGTESVIDLPVEKVVESVTLEKDEYGNDAFLLFKFYGSDPIKMPIGLLTMPMWVNDIENATDEQLPIPPNTVAVRNVLNKISKILESTDIALDDILNTLENEFVGKRTEEGGEIFNDYISNIAGSKAFTIEGVEQSRKPTVDEITHGYDGVYFVPDAQQIVDTGATLVYHSDFDGASNTTTSNSGGGLTFTDDAKSDRSDSKSYLEDRMGYSVLNGTELEYKGRPDLGYRASVNLQLLANNTPVPANSGKSFVFSANVRLGDFVSNGSLFEIRCTLAANNTVMAKPISVDVYGNLVVNGSVIGRLKTDVYTHIVYDVDIANNRLKLYIDGSLMFVGNFLSNADVSKIKGTSGFGNGFALSSVGLYRNSAAEGVIFYIDDLSLYFTDSYKFGLGGAYELDSVEGLAVGDVYSVSVCYEIGKGHGSPPVPSEKREDYGKIIAIEGNKVYVDKLFCNGEFASYAPYAEYSDYNIFCVTAKPGKGTRSVGRYTHVGGTNNRTLQKGAVSFGANNISAGAWSGTIGTALFAAYAAFAINNNNKARAQNSFAGGVSNEVETQAYAGAVLGANNIVRLAYEFICGEYAKLDVPDPSEGGRGKYLFKVGNGKKENGIVTRSDAFAVDRDGNAYAGEKKLATEEYVNANAGPKFNARDAGKFVTIGDNGELIATEIPLGDTMYYG